MSRIPRVHRRVHRLSVLTGLSEDCWQAPPPRPPGTWALLRASARHRLAAPARRARPPRPHPPITAPAWRLAATRLRRLFS
jgi:hypothetical protein